MTEDDSALFRQWLEQAGWARESVGPLGELVALGDSTVALPNQLWSDPVLATGVAERVASAMRLDVREVVQRLVSPLTDRIEFRLIGDDLGNGRIPLGAASEALKNGRRLISASGTSAIAPAWSVARRYRPEAQLLAREAELAHTEDGSFVFPLYITLQRPERPALPLTQGNDTTVTIEPYERRVTRTLATALASAVNLTDRSVEQLSDDDLDTASTVGVTRELCSSLDEMLKNPSVDQVAISFDWSPAFGTTTSLPTTVALPRSMRP
ncbi:hypothetical protein, partial [Aeromicrobium alkaliterrae]|uniref:hypothetical protein n=1 Tax=Aeromicrobium alkaliterrae TaxID=302168 RepID=UPI0031D32E46